MTVDEKLYVANEQLASLREQAEERRADRKRRMTCQCQPTSRENCEVHRYAING